MALEARVLCVLCLLSLDDLASSYRGVQILQVLATQQVASIPDSLLLLESVAAGGEEGAEGLGAGSLFLHIGAHVFCRTE